MDTSLIQDMGQRESVFGILDSLSIKSRTEVQQHSPCHNPYFTPENLFEQPPLELDTASLCRCYGQKVVLVIGGETNTTGEITHQLAQLHPEHLLVLVNQHTHSLLQQLQKHHPNTPITLLDGHHYDQARMQKIFQEMKPEVVILAPDIHPALQTSENFCQLVHYLLFGTIQMARLALQGGCSHFIMVDNDPETGTHSFATATKRLAYHYCQSLLGHTRYITIRSQNALILPISALTLFRTQIQVNKPITITHPEISRHYMAIPTMVRLILQAGAIGLGGETYFLDLGEPFKLVDLAKKMIHLCNLQPDKDISISFLDLRPGEQLRPNSYQPSTTLQPTNHPWLKKITTQNKHGEPLDNLLQRLENAITNNDGQGLLKEIQTVTSKED
ncbi:MAG: polysaccharide biosynthesis protein [Magnetococcales bacterium]|nr:polysaccharide biosynthesis protein [Magnetococcales bacterium]NGZ28614.1 polysaccharide biosynthesis protein [Magnetococcales bacterium]